MVNVLLLSLIDSVLGEGVERKSSGDKKYFCPFCHHEKMKLEISLITDMNGKNPWHCWVCDSKGTTIKSLFNKLKVSQNKIEELNKIVKNSKTSFQKQYSTLELPDNFRSLINVPEKDYVGRNVRSYLLKERKLTDYDILKYNIGYCPEGDYINRVIIPSYNYNNELNFFIARKAYEDKNAYDNPNASKDIIPFENLINWNVPINICEGFFDMVAIKRNAIPLLGKIIPDELMKKIVKSEVKDIYISLDSDALKNSLQHAEKLISYGKNVFLVEIKDKDPGKLGFEKYTKLVQKAKKLDLRKILELKFKL